MEQEDIVSVLFFWHQLYLSDCNLYCDLLAHLPPVSSSLLLCIRRSTKSGEVAKRIHRVRRTGFGFLFSQVRLSWLALIQRQRSFVSEGSILYFHFDSSYPHWPLIDGVGLALFTLGSPRSCFTSAHTVGRLHREPFPFILDTTSRKPHIYLFLFCIHLRDHLHHLY